MTRKRAWLVLTVALTSTLSALGATPALSGLIEAVVRHGPDGQLPAHLSGVLGVGKLNQPTPVKQAVMRDGETVRTFNVCTVNHEDVVLFNTNERSHESKAYLVTPAGVLRKAVYYQAGGAPSERSLASARKDFETEIKFWTDFTQHSKPLGAK